MRPGAILFVERAEYVYGGTRRGACIPPGAIRCMDRSFCSVAGGRADNERRRNGGHATASHQRGNSREGDAAGREPGRAELLRLRTDAEEFAFTQSRVCGDDVPQHSALRNRRSGPLRGYEARHQFSGGFLERREIRSSGRRGGGPTRNGDGRGPKCKWVCADAQLQRKSDRHGRLDCNREKRSR